jgi:AcrR family transcriptional regulator
MSQTKRDRTRMEIIRAAESIIQNEGYEKITVRHLAEVTGYSHTVFYHYFKNLNGLLWALRLEMIDKMISEFNDTPKSSDNPVDGIIGIFTDYAKYFLLNPNTFRFFYFYPFSGPVDSLLESDLESKFQAMWQESFAGLVQENIISQEQIFVVAKSIIYSISGLLLLNLSTAGLASQINIEQEIKDIIKFLLKNK